MVMNTSYLEVWTRPPRTRLWSAEEHCSAEHRPLVNCTNSFWISNGTILAQEKDAETMAYLSKVFPAIRPVSALKNDYGFVTDVGLRRCLLLK